MSERQEWLERRRQYIGSSDTPAILGLDTFEGNTALEVYWSKVTTVPDHDKPQFNVGRRLEAVLCDWLEDRLGVTIARNVFRVSDGIDGGIMAATFDGVIIGRNQGVEAKYSAQSAEWGDEGTDHCPERVVVQAQHQNHVGGFELTWVPAFIVGTHGAEFRLYCVRRHDELIARIVEADVRFMIDHVRAGVPPDGNTTPPLEVLKHLRREPNRVIPLDATAEAAWYQVQAARDACKRAETEKDRAVATMLDLLGDAEAGTLPDGSRVTYLLQKSAPSVDTAMLRALAPEVAERVVKQGTHRTLRRTGAKGK